MAGPDSTSPRPPLGVDPLAVLSRANAEFFQTHPGSKFRLRRLTERQRDRAGVPVTHVAVWLDNEMLVNSLVLTLSDEASAFVLEAEEHEQLRDAVAEAVWVACSPAAGTGQPVDGTLVDTILAALLDPPSTAKH